METSVHVISIRTFRKRRTHLLVRPCITILFPHQELEYEMNGFEVVTCGGFAQMWRMFGYMKAYIR